MHHRIVVNPIVVTPDQVVLPLVVMEYCTVIMPTQVRVVARLDILLLKVRRFDGQPLERDVN